MQRKLVIDLSPGIDETVALTLALQNPNIELLAVTAVSGNIPAERAGKNLQFVLNWLDPPKFPRLGVGTEPDLGMPVDGHLLNGRDGLGDIGFPSIDLLQPTPAERIIADAIRSAPNEVTILTLGPLTNVARAFMRDPELPLLVGHLVVLGGSINAKGDITPAAEFNMYCDPLAARQVFRSKATKSMVPVDIANRFQAGIDLLQHLPKLGTNARELLRKILPCLFRNYRQTRGKERIFLPSVVALLTILYPDLFKREKMAVDIETAGDLTTGMTVFDQRSPAEWRPNMDVVRDFDKNVVAMFFLDEIERAIPPQQ